MHRYMHEYVFVCMYIPSIDLALVRVHMHVRMCTYLCIYACMYVGGACYVYIISPTIWHMCVHVWVYVCTCVCVCMLICMCVCMCGRKYG